MGELRVLLKTGRSFTQVPVANQYNIRLQKFSIDEAFFYVSDRGVMHTTSDTPGSGGAPTPQQEIVRILTDTVRILERLVELQRGEE